MLRTLRPAADAASVFEAFSVADDDLLRQAPPIDTQDAARDYLTTLADDAWAIDVDGRLVGVVVAGSRSSVHRSAWMSYWLAPDARGRGLAAQALATASAALFADGFFRLEIGARLNNPASIRTAERAGYVHEGVNRAELEYDGIRYDTVRMARLATDPEPEIALLGMLGTTPYRGEA